MAMSEQVQEALVNLSVAIGISGSLLLLFWCSWCRRKLHLLLHQMAHLESREHHLYRRRDKAPLYRQMALLFTFSTVFLTSFVAMLSSGEFRYPYLLFPMWVPEPLRFRAGFIVVFVVQAVFTVMQQAVYLMFTLLVAGLADGAALQLRLVQRALLGACRWDTTDQTANPTRADIEQVTVIQVRATPVRMAELSGGEIVDDSADLRPKDDSDDMAAVLQLRRQSERYRLVYRLVSDAADAFSVPLLWLHAAVAAILLLVGYVAAMQLSGQVEVPTNTEAPLSGDGILVHLPLYCR